MGVRPGGHRCGGWGIGVDEGAEVRAVREARMHGGEQSFGGVVDMPKVSTGGVRSRVAQ